MQPELTDLNARLANLIRIATVVAVDYEKAKARVNVGGAKSAWLPWITAMAGKSSNWMPLEIGCQVVVLSPSGAFNQGVILPCLYHQGASINNGNKNEHVTHYENGTVITHQVDSGDTTITTPGNLSIKSKGDITLKEAKSVTVKADAITLRAKKINIDSPDTTFSGNITACGFIREKNS